MTAQATPLKILSLDVENMLRVRAVRIKPDGNILELTGRNRQGKSSVIDALWAALGGEKMIPADPVHDDAKMGTVIVDIGDATGLKYRVTRRIKKKDDGDWSTSLTIENEDGFRSDKPQQILNTLIGALSCDPLDFINKKPKEQFDLLKTFVAGVDFDAIAKANDTDFDERTRVNRDAKALRTRSDAIVIDETAPTEQVDEAALVRELAEAADKNGAVQRFRSEQAARRQRAAERDAAAETARQRIAQLQTEIVALTDQVDADETAAAELRLEISEAGDEPLTVDTQELQAKITAARDTNAKVAAATRSRTEKERLAGEAAALEERSDTLSKAIAARETEKQEAIARAEMPVPGLSFGDGVILLDGHPLAQASQAQKLSLAVAIAMKLQPRLRFLTTKHAALLDDESWAALVRLADEQDLLVIAETVNSSRPTAVVIEDGHVRGAAQQAAE
ncbi:ATP-binding protein [Bradyrhizobium erythrophlei]|uniref:AAA domain-containing protein n=1 Tax=Bradyrhizobium erythrophlei TaxID=1437360 RepID=A0A1H4NL00_9BRAD|nr:ATP-binding protein [Bradyrhizobium erythrophlei]SEB95933.1 AAA domain-containing protein [Bradyrhizobium erythrophlei]